MRQDLSGFYVRRADGTDQLIGTDEEALEFSIRIREATFGRNAFAEPSLREVDPTVGLILDDRGLDRDYAVKAVVDTEGGND